MRRETSSRSVRSWVWSAAILIFVLPPAVRAAPASPRAGRLEFSPVTFKADDGGTISGSLFRGPGPLAVVLAHGAVFDKESWYPLARRLHKLGITALPFDFRGYGTSRAGRDGKGARYLDVLAALRFLEGRGFKRIALIGGSMGGAAVLRALAQTDDPAIVKAVLLAPAGGPPIKQARIEKLFIVSRRDRLHPRVVEIYEATAKPKTLDVLSGSAHAQNIFATAEGAKLSELILRFVASANRRSAGG